MAKTIAHNDNTPTEPIIILPTEKVPVRLPLNPDREDAEQFEILGVNGVQYQIKLGEEVMVPYEVFEALYNTGRYERL